MATVTREREEQDGFDEQMRLLRKAARHSEYRGDDDAAEACRWAESRMRHERAAALAAPPVENDIRAAIQGWALYCFKHHGNDAHLYNGLAALGGVDRDGKGWQAQAPPASDPPGLVANWRPIETAPKRTDVLAGWADRPHWLPQVLQQDDAGMWFNGEESDYRPPTHWMPLPASPQAETKGDE